MRRIVAALLLCLSVAPVKAQLTQAQVDTIINTDVLSCGTGCVTAEVLRFVLQQMTQATFQAQGSGGLTMSGPSQAGWIPQATSATAATWFHGPFLDVKAFGAACDGVTDDTVSIQAAIASSQSHNGTPVYFPAFCATTGTLNITGYVSMFGNGPDSGILPATNITAISINTQASIYLSNFSIIYASPASAGTMAISLTSTSGSPQENVGSIFDRLQIIQAYYGIYTIAASKWVISNSIINASGANALVVQNTNNADSGDSSFFNNQIGQAVGACIYWTSSGGIRFFNNKINVCGTAGIQAALASGAVTTGFYVTANSIEGIAGPDILFQRIGTTGQLLSVIITGNEMAGNTGISVLTDGTSPWITGMTINGGTFQGNPSTSVFGINVDSVTGFAFSGMTVIPSVGGTTVAVKTGSAASYGTVGPISCSAACSQNSVASTNTTQLTPSNGNLFLMATPGNVVAQGVNGVGTTYATASAFEPAADNTFTLGAAGMAWSQVYGRAYFAGAGATAGVNCSGSPTSSFASVNGIVTHC